MKKILHSIIILILLLSYGPIKSDAAGNSLSVGSVQIDNVKVLSLPKQGSTVITTLKEGKNFLSYPLYREIHLLLSFIQ